MNHLIKTYLQIVALIVWAIFALTTLVLLVIPKRFPDLEAWMYIVNYAYLVFFHVPVTVITGELLNRWFSS